MSPGLGVDTMHVSQDLARALEQAVKAFNSIGIEPMVDIYDGGIKVFVDVENIVDVIKRRMNIPSKNWTIELVTVGKKAYIRLHVWRT